jgi:hypothetical protein
MVFGTGELAGLRAFTESTMTDRAAIERREATTDNRGGRILGDWEPVVGLESVPCRYWPERTEPLEREGTTQVQVLAQWGFAFPWGTAILATDRIVIGARKWEVKTGPTFTDASEVVVSALEVV